MSTGGVRRGTAQHTDGWHEHVPAQSPDPPTNDLGAACRLAPACHERLGPRGRLCGECEAFNGHFDEHHAFLFTRAGAGYVIAATHVEDMTERKDVYVVVDEGVVVPPGTGARGG